MLRRSMCSVWYARRARFKLPDAHSHNTSQPRRRLVGVHPPRSCTHVASAAVSHASHLLSNSIHCRLFWTMTAADWTPKPTPVSPYPEPSPSYQSAYKQSINDPAAFWSQAAEAISWYSTKGPILRYNSDQPHDYTWFADRTLNTAFNCLDLHCQDGRSQQTAIIYDSPVSGVKQRITYGELLEQVSKMAGALRANGIGMQDVVMIYMPMIPQAIVSMLACARIGAVHTVVFGGFAANELAKRITDCKPSLILSASCGLEANRVVKYKPLLDEALMISEHAVKRCVIVQRPECRAQLWQVRDVEWEKFYATGSPVAPVPVSSSHPLYILYTSGTTGAPKGVVRDTGGHAVALKWSLRHLFDQQPGSTFWAASDIGWVVGHSYIVYAPLLLGCTTVLYEGKPVGTPDAGALWRVVDEHGVDTLFTAPTAIRAIKKEDPDARLLQRYAGVTQQGSKFRALYLAGERGDPATISWASAALGKPVIDNYWQTESGWPILCNPKGQQLLPTKPGSATFPSCGYNLAVLSDTGEPLTTPNTEGNLALRLPLPPGCLLGLWGNKQRYVSSYLTRFPGYYDTSDSGHVDEQGYVHVMSRSDDVLKVAAHRLSSGALEEAIAAQSAVAEAAVVARHDAIKGQVPVAFITLKANTTLSEADVQRQCVALVRERVGAVASMRDVVVVARLPKTRSGKVLRKVLRALVDGTEVGAVPTIEDVSVIEEVRGSVAKYRESAKSW